MFDHHLKEVSMRSESDLDNSAPDTPMPFDDDDDVRSLVHFNCVKAC